MMRRFGLGLAAVAAVAAGMALAVFLIAPDDLRDPTDEEIRAGILATVRPLAPAEELERRISESLNADAPEEAGTCSIWLTCLGSRSIRSCGGSTAKSWNGCRR